MSTPPPPEIVNTTVDAPEPPAPQAPDAPTGPRLQLAIAIGAVLLLAVIGLRMRAVRVARTADARAAAVDPYAQDAPEPEEEVEQL